MFPHSGIIMNNFLVTASAVSTSVSQGSEDILRVMWKNPSWQNWKYIGFLILKWLVLNYINQL